MTSIRHNYWSVQSDLATTMSAMNCSSSPNLQEAKGCQETGSSKVPSKEEISKAPAAEKKVLVNFNSEIVDSFLNEDIGA